MTVWAQETAPKTPRIQAEPWGQMAWLVEQQPDGPDPGLSLAVMTVEPGRETPRHRHANCTEVLTVTAGSLRVSRGAETIQCATGDSVLVPMGCAHAVQNPGPVQASALIAYSAGSRDYRSVPEDEEASAASSASRPSR